MPRTKLGMRDSRSWASSDQAGPPPPVTTFARTISNGLAGTVRPPISTPSDETSCVSMRFVSIPTARPHVGHLNRVARLGRWNRYREHRRWIAEDIAQLDVALHPGRQVE